MRITKEPALKNLLFKARKRRRQQSQRRRERKNSQKCRQKSHGLHLAAQQGIKQTCSLPAWSLQSGGGAGTLSKKAIKL